MDEPAHLSATRASYDIVAADYEHLLRAELASKPIDRAVLAAFAELVLAAGSGPVVDVGSGSGRITAHLDSLGCDVFGVDLSPGMVAVARRTYPDLRFEEGSMTALDMADGALRGIVAWYSVIRTPPDRLPEVFAEFGRVLALGGQVLLAFQVGDERVRLEQAYGHAVSLDAYRLAPDRVADLVTEAGFVVHTRVRREAAGRERTPQAYLMASRPVSVAG